MSIGKIAQIIRYPIKSLGGEQLEKEKVNDTGVFGDRMFSFREVETGLIVSTKNPLKWAKLTGISSVYQNNKLSATDNETDTIAIGKENIETLIQQVTKRKIQLISKNEIEEKQTREADRSQIDNLGTIIKQERLSIASEGNHFFDVAPLHILTTSSLNKMKSHYPEGDFSIERFRPNLVIDTGGKNEFTENNWIGKTIRIGEELRIKIIEHCPRCVVTTLKRNDLEKDFRILKTIVKNNSAESQMIKPGEIFKGVLGVYGIIEREGNIKIGDGVSIEEK